MPFILLFLLSFFYLLLNFIKLLLNVLLFLLRYLSFFWTYIFYFFSLSLNFVYFFNFFSFLTTFISLNFFHFLFNFFCFFSICFITLNNPVNLSQIKLDKSILVLNNLVNFFSFFNVLLFLFYPVFFMSSFPFLNMFQPYDAIWYDRIISCQTWCNMLQIG